MNNFDPQLKILNLLADNSLETRYAVASKTLYFHGTNKQEPHLFYLRLPDF